MDDSKVIRLCESLLGKSNKNEQAEFYLAHSRTMIMMFEATGFEYYLDRSVADLMNAQSLLRGGFVRPLGVTLNEVA